MLIVSLPMVNGPLSPPWLPPPPHPCLVLASSPDASLKFSATFSSAWGPAGCSELRGADFSGRSLVEHTFDEVDLWRALFVGSDLSKAHFRATEGSYADFRNASAELAAFDGATLQGASFDGAMLVKASFAKLGNTACDARRATFIGSDLRGVDFSMANLAGADFRGANLENAKLTESNVTGANFLNARGLDSADFTDAVGMATASLPPSYYFAMPASVFLMVEKLGG